MTDIETLQQRLDAAHRDNAAIIRDHAERERQNAAWAEFVEGERNRHADRVVKLEAAIRDALALLPPASPAAQVLRGVK